MALIATATLCFYLSVAMEPRLALGATIGAREVATALVAAPAADVAAALAVTRTAAELLALTVELGVLVQHVECCIVRVMTATVRTATSRGTQLRKPASCSCASC